MPHASKINCVLAPKASSYILSDLNIYVFLIDPCMPHVSSIPPKSYDMKVYSPQHIGLKRPAFIILDWFTSTTERRGRVVKTPASYSGCSRFKSGPGDRLSWLRSFVVFSAPLSKCRDRTAKLGHDPFLSRPFQFVIKLLSFHSVLYSLCY
jgi:hypothetical protein